LHSGQSTAATSGPSNSSSRSLGNEERSRPLVSFVHWTTALLADGGDGNDRVTAQRSAAATEPSRLLREAGNDALCDSARVDKGLDVLFGLERLLP
jgi:hypothetical protein